MSYELRNPSHILDSWISLISSREHRVHRFASELVFLLTVAALLVASSDEQHKPKKEVKQKQPNAEMKSRF